MRKKLYGKRLLDLMLCSLLSGPFLLLSLPILLISGFVFRGKVFFVQERIGRHNRRFRIYKFTTLKEEGNGNRQTRWGSFMRNYSLDEMPQLINILKGEMSFVGPRPLLPEYLPLYTATEALRHQLKPGLTGLAQVSGRNKLSWSRKMACDICYIRRQTLLLDLQIIFKTAYILLKGQEVNYGTAPAIEEVKWVKV